MAITVIVNKPDGEIEALALEPPAEIQAGPGFVFEFPDLDSSHIEYLVGGDDQDDLTIVLPDGGGEITLVGFHALLAGEEKATIRWGFGIEDGEQVAPDAGADGGSGGVVSLIDSMIDFLTGLSLESLMNIRVGFRDAQADESEEFEFEFPEQAELLSDAAPRPRTTRTTAPRPGESAPVRRTTATAIRPTSAIPRWPRRPTVRTRIRIAARPTPSTARAAAASRPAVAAIRVAAAAIRVVAAAIRVVAAAIRVAAAATNRRTSSTGR